MNESYISNGRDRIKGTTQRLILMILVGSLTFMSAMPISALAGGILPPLGVAASFGVLAGSAVTNTGPTTVRGNLGVSPGTAVSGFPPGIVSGTIHAGDAVAAQAQTDATIAYNNAAGQACDFDLTGQNLGGMTLTPGVYCFASSAQLTGQLTLNGQGNPDSVFIFKIGSTLTTASNATVLVINSALPCRIFWQVGSSATLGTNTNFAGNILALTSITLNTGTSTSAGLYALNGAITLDTNDIQACGFAQGATPTPTLGSTATAGSTFTSTSTSTSTATAAISTATTVPSTNTSIPAATNTSVARATATTTTVSSTATSTATSIPGATNTPAPEATSVPNNTATAIALATTTAIPPATAIATNTAISTASAIAIGTAVETAISTSITTTPTTAIALGTVTVGGPAEGTFTPVPSVAVPGDTPITTQMTMTPTPRPLLPPTGGGQPWNGLFILLLSVLLMFIGLNIHILARKVGIRLGRDA